MLPLSHATDCHCRHLFAQLVFTTPSRFQLHPLGPAKMDMHSEVVRNLADAIGIEELKAMPMNGPNALHHYGRLKSMRAVADKQFGPLGEKGQTMFGEEEMKFLIKEGLARSVDACGFGLKTAQSLLTCLNGKRIGHPKKGAPPCVYLGQIGGPGGGKSRLSSSTTTAMELAEQDLFGKQGERDQARVAERGGGGQDGAKVTTAKLVTQGFTEPRSSFRIMASKTSSLISMKERRLTPRLVWPTNQIASVLKK